VLHRDIDLTTDAALRIIGMKTVTLTLPELLLLVATRAMLGAGIALLISKRLSDPQRETAGLVLTGVGIITTIPLAFEVLGKTERG
jgi:hypothetical protein